MRCWCLCTLCFLKRSLMRGAVGHFVCDIFSTAVTKDHEFRSGDFVVQSQYFKPHEWNYETKQVYPSARSSRKLTRRIVTYLEAVCCHLRTTIVPPSFVRPRLRSRDDQPFRKLTFTACTSTSYMLLPMYLIAFEDIDRIWKRLQHTKFWKHDLRWCMSRRGESIRQLEAHQCIDHSNKATQRHPGLR